MKRDALALARRHSIAQRRPHLPLWKTVLLAAIILRYGIVATAIVLGGSEWYARVLVPEIFSTGFGVWGAHAAGNRGRSRLLGFCLGTWFILLGVIYVFLLGTKDTNARRTTPLGMNWKTGLYRVTWMAAAVALGMILFFIPQVGSTINGWLLAGLSETNVSPMGDIEAVYFPVAFLGGLTLSMPMLIYQVLRFVTPALTPQEKRWIIPIVVGTSVSFFFGLVFGYLVVLPAAYAFLFDSIAVALGGVVDVKISSIMHLASGLLLSMGFVFETPLLVMGLAKLRGISARQLLLFYPLAVIIAYVFAAMLSPAADAITTTLYSGTLCIGYLVGIVLLWLSGFVRTTRHPLTEPR